MAPSATPLSYPLSPAQTRSFLEDSLPAAKLGLNIEQLVCRTREEFDAARFKKAWSTVINRHAALGVDFRRDSQQHPYQRVHRNVQVPVSVEERPEKTAAEIEGFMERWLEDDRRHLLDFTDSPVMRFAVFRFGDQSVTWVWTFHAIVMDTRSAVLALEDFFTCYESLEPGRDVFLPKRVPFSEFIAWQHDWAATHEESARAFFRELVDDDEIDAHLSIKRAHAPQDYRQEKIAFAPDDATRTTLARQAAETGITLKTLVHGAWALLLSRYYRTPSVTFGAIRFCRSGSIPGTESMIGVLMNLLPVHARLSAGTTVLHFLQALQDQQTALHDHRWSALDLIRNSLPAAAGKQLLDSCVLFERRDPVREMNERFGSGETRPFSLRQSTNMPLVLAACEQPGLEFELIYQSSLFEKEEIARLVRSFLAVLRQMVAAMHEPIGRLEAISVEDKTALAHALTGPDMNVPDLALHEWFEAQAKRTPHELAIVGECELTYEQLDRRAASLALRLVALEIAPDRLVAVFLPRSSALVVAILGVLKSGAAFLPVDIELPPARRAALLDEAKVAAIITSDALVSKLPDSAAPRVVVDPQDDASPATAATLPPVRGTHLAYAISTSGTTGRPKLIGVEHRQIANLLTFATQKLLQLEDVRCVPFTEAPTFDPCVMQIFTTLALGGTLVCIPDIAALADSPFFDQFTCFQATPSVQAAVLKSGSLPPHARLITMGGEAIPPDLLERLDVLPRVQRILNLYGPTETTVYCTCAVVLDRAEPCNAINVREGGRVIGRPIANTRVHIVDEFGQLAPPGAPGELLVAGAQVARGYLNAAGESAKNFGPDRFAPDSTQRLYRTGDLVRLRTDGQLEFLGRKDAQLKVNGVRMEAAEIENALHDYPGIRQALVDLRHEGGAKRLVAYLATDGATISKPDLKRALRQRLPEAMIPHHFLFLPSLPVVGHGKVDRPALARLELEPRATAAPTAPLSAAERQMTALWEQNLGRSPLALDHDYFEFGGDSLSAVNLLAAVEKQFGLRLKPAQLFDNSTIAGLLRVMQQAGAEPEPAEAGAPCSFVCLQPSGSGAPLIILQGGTGVSYAHYRNFAHKFAPEHPVYVLQSAFSLLIDKPSDPLSHIVDHVTNELLATVGDRPFILFGHCIGGLLAWHVACALKKRDTPRFSVISYGALVPQDGINLTEDEVKMVDQPRLRKLIQAYRPAWEEWRMDHGTSWWTSFTFGRWVATNFLSRRGWIKSKEDPLKFVKLSYLRLLERSPLDVFPDDALLVYHHEQADMIAKSLWPSLCAGDLQVEYIAGTHRVWQAAVLSIVPLIRRRLEEVAHEEAGVPAGVAM